MKKLTLLIFTAYTFNATAQSNIGMNTTSPDASALLDITANNRGLLIPRLALTASNVAAPVTTPALSLLIFNTATAGIAPNDVKPGYYYWNGTKWVGIGTGNAWELLGNSGTTAGTNFIGTTDAQDLVVKTNNVENMRISNTSWNVGIGTNAPAARLHVAGGGPIGAGIEMSSSLTSYTSSTALSLINTDLTPNNMINIYFGDNNIGGANAILGARYTSHVTGSKSTDFEFYNTDVGTFKMPMIIKSNGYVGIGTAAPTEKLDIAGNVKFSNALMPAGNAGTAGQVLTSAGAGIAPTWGASAAMPAGLVLHFANITAPAGYLECNGQAVSRTTYAPLFTAIGTLYGAGDGSTTFNVPDLRGEFIRGADNARGVDAGRVMGSSQADMFKSHNHNSFQMWNQAAGWSAAITNSYAYGWYTGDPSTQVASSNTGGTENRPRNVAMMPCIKF
jgi:microcystin-dependent protein